MSNKRIVWKMPDGSLRITTPAEPRIEGETEDAYLDRVAERTKEVLQDLEGAVRLANITAEEHAEMRRVRDLVKKNQ
jgi:hypothetical protein